MMGINVLTALFLIFLAIGTIVQFWLAFRQIKHVSDHRDTVPQTFSEKIGLEEHQKAADYTIAKTHFSLSEITVSVSFLLIWTLGGGIQLLDSAWQLAGYDPLLTGLLVIISFAVIGYILDIPLASWHTFSIEQAFGFNKTKIKTFILDRVKGFLLLLLIGTPLAWVILWLMTKAGQLWWLYVWVVWMSFILLITWAFPRFIAPIFNKFTPLGDQSLKTRIESLLERCGFKSSGVYIMDGSTRSSHGNAYFTGIGSNKRIVFFDTLIDTLKPKEIEAVLAHELGHFKKNHVKKNMLLMATLSLAGLALLGWLIGKDWFYLGLGVKNPSVYNALILFMLAVPVFTFFITPAFSKLSRKHEFEADAYASEQTDQKALASALVKLYKDNANTLTPDPIHSAFYDSHPPATLRVSRLMSQVPGVVR